MNEFKQEILACVGPPNPPTKDQVKRLCQQASSSENASETLQETLLERLERPRELKVSTLEIEHILVVIRQCCFIAPPPFIEFFKSRLYLLASFCNHEDPWNSSGAARVRKAAWDLCDLLKNDYKLCEERRKSNPSFSQIPQPIWHPTTTSYQDVQRVKDIPISSPTARRSFLPTPDASPIRRCSTLMIQGDEPLARSEYRGTGEELVLHRPTEDEIETTIRQLLRRPIAELLDSRTALRKIAQATFDERQLQIIISLFLEYVLTEDSKDSANVMMKVLRIMEYCLRHGSPKYLSTLKDYQQTISRLREKPYPRQISTLAKTILESLGSPTAGSSVSQQNHSPDRSSILSIPASVISNQIPTSSIFTDQENIRDLTPFVTQKDSHSIARGGYADVYSAELVVGCHSEQVAKKVLHRKVSNRTREQKRLLREINAWTGLKHPNVGLLYGITTESEDRIGLISPFYKRGDVVKHIKNLGDTLDNKAFLTIMKEVTAGVVYLHGKGIIHGDIKGSNIMVDDNNCPRLIDFGVSRIVDVHGFTTSGSGTSWAWAAPELLQDDARKTQQSDIYALASTFVEMMIYRPPLSGKFPLIALSKGEIPKRPMAGSHRFYPGDRLWCYLMHCWEKAETRPTAVEVAQFLDELHDITDDEF